MFNFSNANARSTNFLASLICVVKVAKSSLFVCISSHSIKHYNVLGFNFVNRPTVKNFPLSAGCRNCRCPESKPWSTVQTTVVQTPAIFNVNLRKRKRALSNGDAGYTIVALLNHHSWYLEWVTYSNLYVSLPLPVCQSTFHQTLNTI